MRAVFALLLSVGVRVGVGAAVQTPGTDGCRPLRFRPNGRQCYSAEVDAVSQRVHVSIGDDFLEGPQPAAFSLPARYGRATVVSEPWGPGGTDLLVVRLVGNSGSDNTL